MLSNLQTSRAEDIRTAIAESEAAARQSIDKALEAGRLLVEAKADCKHGEWLPFLARAGVHERQAQRLMKLARSNLESDTVSDLGGIKAALEFLAKREEADKIVRRLEHPQFWSVAAKIAMGVDYEEVDPIPGDAARRDEKRLLNLVQTLEDMKNMFATTTTAA